jgi:hypothetical protein
MIVAALVMLSALTTTQVQSPREDSPTAADKAILQQVAARCHLHAGAIYFVQYDVPREPVIHTTRALGDTEAQITCALQNLPEDFSVRFGLDTEPMPPGL